MAREIDEDYNEGVTIDEWADHRYDDYELKSYEKKSLREIRKGLTQDTYTKVKDCEEHMEYLEDLANKVSERLSNERRIGQENWSLEQARSDIRTLYKALAMRREELLKK